MQTFAPLLSAVLMAAILAGCAPVARQGALDSGTAQSAAPRASGPKRIVVGLNGEPEILPGTAIPGDSELRTLVHAGATAVDHRGDRRGVLVEASPSIENGLWRLLPDGRMETTWRLRETARWHDGTALTSDDLVFTARVGQDRDLGAFGHVAYSSVESVEAIDARAVIVRWRRPYIEADTLFTQEVTYPMPRHILARALDEDKATFTQIAYWNQEFVGAGPFKVREWVRGSHLLLDAFDGYALGRPKLDEVEVRFISDANVLMANVLSGAVQLTAGRALSIEQAIQVREQWREGKASFEFGTNNWLVLFPQFVNPNPAVIADLRFRRGLMYAIDRQEMADTLNAGLVPIAHSYLSPNQPEYTQIEGRLVRYEFDPRRAVQAFEALGYARSSDGTLRDPAAQRVEIEIRNIGLEISRKAMFAVADYWQRLGMAAPTVVIPPQRVADYEYRATFPGFQLFNQPNDIRGLPNLHSSRARLPENSYSVPGAGNHARYMTPEFDALLDRFYGTIPRQERVQALGEIAYHISDQLNLMGLFYNATPEMIASRVLNISTDRASLSIITWNAHEWDAAT